MAKMFNYEADHIHDMVHPKLLTDSAHYVVECKDIILTETTPNYPKLTDYESEWLYFYEHVYQGGGDPVDLEYQTLVFDQHATVDNAIPYNYKQAVLKGKTLINYATGMTFQYVTNGNYCIGNIKDSEKTSNKTITIYNGNSYDVKGIVTNLQNGWIRNLTISANSYLTVTLTSSEKLWRINTFNNSGISLDDYAKSRLMIYDGDFNNIPYFESMLSVKVPVLTTTGKNLLYLSPDRLERVTISGTSGEISESKTRCATKYIKATPKDNLFLKRFDDNYKIAVRYYHNNKIVNTSLNSNGNFITDRNLKNDSYAYYNQIRLIFAKQDNSEVTPQEISSLQVMLTSSEDDIFEPYKSNILTVNEDVTLRSNGDICDELNLLTGQLTQRIGEDGVVLSQEVVKSVDLDNSSFEPYEGTNHYYTSSDTIAPSCELSVPVESTGAQTLMDINQGD